MQLTLLCIFYGYYLLIFVLQGVLNQVAIHLKAQAAQVLVQISLSQWDPTILQKRIDDLKAANDGKYSTSSLSNSSLARSYS